MGSTVDQATVGGAKGRSARTGLATAVMLAVVASLTGCSEGPALPKMADLNPFLKKDPPLTGKRVPIMEVTPSRESPDERPQ